ncbi:D-alanine--D-alanine ligase [Soehngenia longivitae]|uniref:D-alanine--D-alanine ligase n=1 Tax=Soehngenia longivitae TaxID=2562294 RepID=A0A4Z0D8L9_9FIRM|nr:D-alanine--D-alanine ligase family protein [Soehngenia longivitae]TFZ41203.1 D-alanine--D-alanine ligase [Soehngenia longivitae]
MKNVGILFGGRSVEHEVSVITAMQIIENIDKTKFNPIPIYVNKNGEWLVSESFLKFESFKNEKYENVKKIILSPNYKDQNLYIHPNDIKLFTKKDLDSIDVFFPAFHGTNGEDGTIQGLLELIGLPYVGAGVLSSAVGMDKIIMKDIFKANDIPVVDYTYYYRSSWKTNKEAVLKDIESKITYPLFVKPANLGSSIGISKVKSNEDLESAIELAFSYDRKIIIEKAVEDPREINCAVMGYEDDLEVSLCEEPLGWKEILSFDDKYVKQDSKTTKGDKNKNIPANLSDEIRTKIENYAKLAFKSIDCRGNARIDFLVKEEDVYVNEINTMPGSIAFYLWEGRGYSFKELISKMIDIAIKAQKDKEANMYTYDSNLFKRTQFGAKIKK